MTAPNYGPIAEFTGTSGLRKFGGPRNSSGLNSIFRPQSEATPTAFPTPVPGATNVLELNPVLEVLTFVNSLGLLGVPVNRGAGSQGDITLVPVFYDHYVEDATIPESLPNLESGATIIHQEVGMWLLSPPTTNPAVPASIQRLGVIPHGVTFCAQGFYQTIEGPPTIPPMNTADATVPSGIQPFVTGSNADGTPDYVPTPSLTAAAQGTARLPQDLTSFITEGTVTQDILNDPNTILRDVIAEQDITQTTIITVSTDPADPLIGGMADPLTSGSGGVTNTAFLLNNVVCQRFRATFFIEMYKGAKGELHPQIQYTQEILLNFGGVTFPHMTVATLTVDPSQSLP